jgi:hypothetical protein
MKRCGQCGTTYTDQTLRFCLADGAVLVDLPEEPTVASPRDRGMRVDIPSPHSAATFETPPARSSSSLIIKVVIAVLVIGFLGLIIVSLAGVGYYFVSRQSSVQITHTEPSPMPVSSPTAETTPEAAPANVTEDVEKKIEDELAKLQKQLEDLAKTVPELESLPDSELGSGITATVNSPKDGFLALRSLPSTDVGNRVARIPHGEEVEVALCQQNYVTVSGRRGRWCLISWEGNFGWAFDAWLEF